MTSSPEYPCRDWTAENRKALDDFVQRHPGGGCIAVDMDGTCIHNDLGAARWYRAVREGFVDFADQDTRKLVPFPRLRDGLAQLARSQREADRLMLLGSAIGLFQSIHELHGIRVSFPWTPGTYRGHSRREFEEFTRRVVEAEFTDPIGFFEAPTLPAEFWDDTPLSPPQAFRVAVGIRPYRPMVDLLNGLRGRGFRIFVVSATEETAVRMCVDRIGLQADGIAAMRLKDDGGFLLPEVHRPALVEDGKIEALKNVSGDDRPVLLAAGDTSNDLCLLNHSCDLALLIDHGKPWFHELIRSVRPGLTILSQPRFIDSPAYYTGE